MYILLHMVIYIYTAFRHLRGAQDLFTSHSYPGSWCILHQADTAMVKHYPTSMQRAVELAQLPRHVVIQMNKLP